MRNPDIEETKLVAQKGEEVVKLVDKIFEQYKDSPAGVRAATFTILAVMSHIETGTPISIILQSVKESYLQTVLKILRSAQA